MVNEVNDACKFYDIVEESYQNEYNQSALIYEDNVMFESVDGGKLNNKNTVSTKNICKYYQLPNEAFIYRVLRCFVVTI